jgi:transcription-repair coupling factor (superfamily II helicase)
MADKRSFRHDFTLMHISRKNIPTGLAWLLAESARRPGLRVFICRDLRSYRLLSEETAFFLQDAPELLWRFPAWEMLPYDHVSPHREIVGERLSTLARLIREPEPSGILLTALPAWMQRIPPPEIISAHVWRISVGDQLDLGRLRTNLTLAGLQSVDRVMTKGEYALRGGLLDIWPATEELPLRLDLFGDEIESIRRFDPETQRSGEELSHFISVPVREVILDEAGRKRFSAAFRQRFPHLRKHSMLAAVSAGRSHPGIESLLPLAYERCCRLQDYLPDGAEIVADEDIERAREDFASQVRSQFELVRLSKAPVVAPQELYATETPVHAGQISGIGTISPPPDIIHHQHDKRPLHSLLSELRASLDEGWRIMLVAHGLGQQERMIEVVRELGIEICQCHGLHDFGQARLGTAIGLLASGFSLPRRKIILLTGRELLGQRLPRRRGKASTRTHAELFSSLRELKYGDLVVHEDHGVGRYLGLTSIEDNGIQADFLHIEYADQAAIHLPVEGLDRLHRFIGEETPSLDKLGSRRWKRTRERVRRDILALAHEIIALEARRKSHKRRPYRLQGDQLTAFEEFVARFPFEETDDQAKAIRETLNDLAAERPMDRVICGDVGFGKTEIALRAAFVVARSGKQVVLLAPTTVLANQHFSTFCERFAGMEFDIVGINRLQTRSQLENSLEKIRSGEADIVIGTHRLLSSDVRFRDLGLVIVDEEHRFGVSHKEKLKKLHEGIDLLTLSATPIPRTLNQALSGLRSVSIINTPPEEREAIRTMISSYDKGLVREAIRRELFRGGQIYYVHNHVKSIRRIASTLADEVPEAEIGIAHGQMSPSELDRQMLAFYEGKLHILVCTTIIESGLDVPNANTLIVERADLLGLAQLHQIRGRVGRSHHQAYAYFFTPPPQAMTREARQRLEAIAEHSELGSGFWLARRDMEIRGAGNLLGAEQSGHIDALGLDLYLELLSEALDEARGGEKPAHRPVEIHLNLSAILPPDYIPQIPERLALYRRLARADSDERIDELREEIIDRFGRMPAEAACCLNLARIRWRASAMRLNRLEADPERIRFDFSLDSPLDPEKLLARVQREPARYRLLPDGSLSLLGDFRDPDHRLKTCLHFLDELLAG